MDEIQTTSTIIDGLLTYGPFAVLFAWLLFYTLKENSKREINYQNIINKLTDKFDVVEDIKKDVDEIKIILKGVK